jgi:exopolyphosphatase/guanosine-5'-triphosphate,3'-diphosphate pyrophosphatase
VAAGAELEEALEPFASRHWAEALGSSGTVGAVSQILAANGISDGRVTPEGLQWLMERCLEAGSAERLDLPGLKEERRAVIGGGLAILYTLAAHFGIDALMPARGALRQGVIFDLDARHALERRAGGEDLREQSVHALQRRFGVDIEQAGRVAGIASALLDGVGRPVDPESRRELGWTAALHEAGMMVSHHDHHRHSAYMLAHVDAPGFSQNQLQRMSALALGQRGGLRKLESQLHDSSFALRLLCLRLAVIVCHAREPVDASVLALQQGGEEATIGVDPDWARAHPRALHLLREEVAAWAKVKTGARPPRLIEPEG